MNAANGRHALVAIAVAAGLVGLAFLGLAFGASLRAEDLSMMSRHPLFGVGVESLTGGATVALVFLGLGCSRTNR